MPIQLIQVSEYECVYCGYKWINRLNGKDGPVPKNCAKCKRKYWNGDKEEYNPITPRERGLRKRLYRYEGTIHPSGGMRGSTAYWPNELCNKFLALNPRPTIKELLQALYPLGHDLSKAKFLTGDLEYDYSGKQYAALIKIELEKRREFMKRIIEERRSKS